MKIKPISNVKVFLAGGLAYILLLVAVMSLFAVRDAEGYFSGKDFFLFAIIYQIPISLINSAIYAYMVNKITKGKVGIKNLLKINIPLLWFPLSVVRYFMLYWVKNGDIIQTKDGYWIDKGSENAGSDEQI